MKCLNTLKVIVLLSLLVTELIYSQSISFIRLIDGQIRSDYCSSNYVWIPTEFNCKNSSFPVVVCSTFVRLKAYDGNGIKIGEWDNQDGNYIPDLNVGPGTYTLTIILIEVGLNGQPYEAASQTVTIQEKYTLYAYSNLDNGLLYADGNVSDYHVLLKGINEGMTVSAIDQYISDGSYWRWKENGIHPSNWQKLKDNDNLIIPIPGAISRTYTYNVQFGDNHSKIIADMRKLCRIDVNNNFATSSNPGQIQVNHVTYDAPYYWIEIQGEEVTLSPVDMVDNNMSYIFDHWEDGSTSRDRAITISEPRTFTAYYKGTPLYSTTDRNLNVSNAVRECPVLTWNEHSNSSVTSYKIYRKVLKGIHADPGSLIAEVPRGTLTYTDFDYFNSGLSNQDEIFYDVDAYSQAENTSSSQSWAGIYYGILVKSADSLNVRKIDLMENLENSLGNYPNPFNPTTQIKYSLKENGFVSLQVYDILGNKVADLVNEYKPAGSYIINFDASNLPSGIYISTITASNYRDTKKMLLVK